jgi:uncharacterized protein (TIGR02611 family)
MIERVKKFWEQFRAAPPGQRFQTLYRHQQDRRSNARLPAHFINVTCGIVLVIAGVVLIPAPGPGWAIVAVGFALLSREFLAVARAADAIDLKLRHWARRCKALARAAR